MTTAQIELVLAIVLGVGILFVALKWGTIGGGGIGAERLKDPFNFWLGVTITGLGILIAAIVLIADAIWPDRFGR